MLLCFHTFVEYLLKRSDCLDTSVFCITNSCYVCKTYKKRRKRQVQRVRGKEIGAQKVNAAFQTIDNSHRDVDYHNGHTSPAGHQGGFF